MNYSQVTLNEIKENVIRTISNELSELKGLSQKEIDLKKQISESSIKLNRILSTKAAAEGLIDASEISQTLNNLYIDLLTSFNFVNELEKKIDNYQNLNLSVINNMMLDIANYNDKLEEFERTMLNKFNESCYIDNFSNYNSMETDRKFYKERYLETAPDNVIARYDTDEKCFTLYKNREENMINYKNGVSTAYISINKQLGAGFVKSSESLNPIENAIDTSMKSYWSDTILSDKPIKVEFSNIKPTVKSEIKDFYYGIKHGAMFEIEITFESITMINEIILKPFCKYPVDIVAIRYKLTDDVDDDIEEVITPDNIIETRKGKSSKDTMSFSFPDILCKRVYIVCNQIHYIKTNYIYNVNDVYKNNLWYNFYNKNFVKEGDKLFTPIYDDRVRYSNAWSYINNIISKNKKLDLNMILFNNDTTKTCIKYQYDYGFYNITANNNDYNRVSIFASSLIDYKNNIKDISIETTETHPISSDNTIATDIEYYVTFSEDQISFDQWYPVLPTNKPVVDCELLQQFDDKCYLRFPAEEIYKICINGSELTLGTDYFIHKITTETKIDSFLRLENVYDMVDCIYAVNIPNFNQFATYTISYKPHKSAYIINLLDENENELISEKTTETIQCNNNSIYKLSNFPFFDIENSYTNVRLISNSTSTVLTEDNTISSQIKCVTDTSDTANSYKNFNNLDGSYQYYIDKNYIYFNQNVSKDYTIEINYKHFVSKLRLKAILRRNTAKDGWLSPKLHKIKYNCSVSL